MNTSVSKVLTHRSFLLATHYATFAYQDLLFTYLTEHKASLVTKINLPLPELPFLKHIEVTHCVRGIKTTVKKIPSMHHPPILAYIIMSLQLLWLVLSSRKTYDVVIAEDSSVAFICLLLRTFEKCKTVVFYSHGIDKKRFGNRLLNILYQSLDKFCATQSDYNWFLNHNMRDVRKSQGIAATKLYWIPASIPIRSIPRKPNVYNHKLVFLGVLSRKNGADLLAQIVFHHKKKIPDITLDIIGEGELSDSIRSDVKRLHLKNHIKLHGLLKEHEFLPMITSYTVGMAPYEDDFMTLSSSSDPMKMRIYLSAGLPVVITKGFNFSDEIAKNNLGYAVDFTVKSFVNAVELLLKDKTAYRIKRSNALAYSKKYDIITIYDKTFAKILKGNNFYR